MNVVISRPELVALIGKIQSIVATKPAIPILANILIEATSDQLIVSATDLTVSMRSYVDAKIVQEGSIALPAKRFFQLVRELTSPQIKITSQNGESAEITAGQSVFKINGMHHSEFPKLPDLSGGATFGLSAKTLKELLHRTSFCAAKEDSRYVLNGIYLNIANQNATFIGTDGKRLSKVQEKIDIDPSTQGSYILPLKAVDEMARMLDGTEEQVQISLLPDKASLESPNLILITKLLAGQYPDVERVIPEEPKHTISIHREELTSLLRQIALFTSDNMSSVRFIFENSELVLTACSNDIGEGKVSMPVDYAAEKLEIAFNPFYFIDILRHSKDDTISFSINDAYNPGLITDTSSAEFVIMPMRLNEAEPQNAKENAPEKPALT